MFQNYFIFPGVMFAPPSAQLIDFLDVRDVCRGLLLAAQALGEDRPGVAGEVFFMSKPRGGTTTGTDIANMCCKFLGWKVLVVPLIVLSIVRGLDKTLQIV